MRENSFILGILTARGGSKGVPQKNIRPLCGHPLISYTIQAAGKSNMLSDCIVSTDSEEIADISRSYGAKVPFLRPQELAEDDTPSYRVLQHAVTVYQDMHDCNVDIIVLLQPTTPFRTTEDIDNAVKLFIKTPEADSLISCFCDAAFHPRVMYTLKGNRLIPLLEGKQLPVRRQEFEKVYVRNGAIYITKKETLMKKNTIIGDYLICYEMPFIRSINIDEVSDFKLAEVMMENKEQLKIRENG
jgi:CMP-N-acetylneuraminic acid synthetase